ncbi:beta strand repeat-containing protein [Polaromonas sp. YR568]|uniref:beta strand repeat-containing protein n=1 Tax=Polaromonas sp. YR568 TaxID=1855301 RepID=UPI00398BE9FE
MQAKSHPQNLCPPFRRRPSFALKTLPAAIALLFAPPGWTVDIVGAAGLPQNGTVVAGTASGSVTGNQMTINQVSNRAVMDWGSFNIDAGKAVQIAQPNAASAILNRVTGDANASQILGSLSANGTVMLMNPNGVMFGQGAVVNVGSLIATTGQIDAANFMNTGGAQITGATGSVINEGSITAQGAGLVALVAPSVANRGSIIATGGTIALGGATAATVSLNGGLYEFAIAGGATGVNVTNAAGATLNGATLRLGVGDAANLLSGVINLEGVQQASNAIVVNGNAVVLKSALQAPNVSGNSSHIDVYGGARIQDAVNIARTGTPGAGALVDVHAGSYAEQVTLNKANMTLTGQSGAKLVVPDTAGQLNGIGITANNVTVTGMEIAGPVNQPYTQYAWGSGITRGIAVANGVTGFTIANNNIHDVRNGILVDGRNTGSITGNRIENTKSGISVQYTDGSGITIAGNSQGPVGNEWGLNLHLNGYVAGSNIVSNPIAASPTLVWQQALLALSAANGGWSVQDQGYTSSNRTHVNVATTGASGVQGSALTPLGSIQGGVDAVVTGGTVNVAAGTYTGAVSITKSLTLDGAGIGQTIVKAPSAATGNAVTIEASNVTLSDLSINDSLYGLQMKGTSNNVTIDRVSFNNKYGVRNGTDVKADNFRMLNSSITGGVIGFQTYNGFSAGAGQASFKNALFENVTVDGSTFKGFYFETADNLTMRNVTVANAGNVGDDSHQYGAGIDVNLKYGAYGFINFDNVVVKNSGLSSGSATAAAVVIKTRGIAGDSSDYARLPASLQSVNITGGSIEGAGQTGIRFETLANGSGGQPTVTISGTQFKNNAGKDIVVDGTSVDARGAVFVGAADGFAIEDRVTHALDATGRGLVTWTQGNVYVTQASGSIQRGIDAVALGGTVNLNGGTYVQPTTLKLNRGVTLAGSGQGATVIDARGVVNNYGIHVTADNATLRDFTLYGPSANVASAYGIKVAPAGGASDRLRNFTIRNVTSRGAGRAELDLNGVDGAVIDSVTANGALVGNDASSTQGAGIQLTDSANVTITNSTTRNNAWGGLALYQANRSYNQQMNNITVAGNNNFTERNPVYLQDESASRDFGALSIAGFDFAVRNASTAGGNNQYTWLQASQQNAYDFAVNLGSSASSYVQGWNGARATQDFYVGTGSLLGGGTQALSVNTALGSAGGGANIRVDAGNYAEDVVVNNPYNLYFNDSTLRSLALNSGASGSGISGTVTASGAGGISFNAPVSLLGDTTLATLGADINLNGDIQNAGGVGRALRLIAGSGSTRGNVHMVTGGSEANALGQFEVVSNNFKLDSTLWVKGYGIGALGNVALSDHTLRGQDAGATNTVNAGGDVSGSTISLGAVEVNSGGDVSANVTASEVAVAAVGDISGTTTSQGNVQVSSSAGDVTGSITGNDVFVQALGDVNVVVVAARSASLAGDNVTANVVAPVLAVAAVREAVVSGASPQVTVNAASGTVSGNFGQVTNSGGGLVAVNGKPQGNQQLSSMAENNRVIPTGNNFANNFGGDLASAEPALQLSRASIRTGEGEAVTSRSSPSNAGEAIDNGEAVELDMSPKNEREKE